VTALGADPTGLNINHGVGSTHLDPLARAVVEHRPTLAWRSTATPIACFRQCGSGGGCVVDGRSNLALLAVSLSDAGQLRDHTVVATVMSNLGLHLAMRDRGLKVLTTRGGHRYVLEALREPRSVTGR